MEISRTTAARIAHLEKTCTLDEQGMMIYSYIVHLPSSAPLKFCRVISVGGDLFPPLKVLASTLHVGVGPVDVDVGIRFASLSRVLCLRKRQREKGTEDLPKSATIVTISAVYRTYQRKFVSSPSRSAATTAHRLCHDSTRK